MSDHSELRRLAEVCANVRGVELIGKRVEFHAAANPAAVLALIAEVEALRDALCGVMEQIEGNIRVTVRDCVNGMDDVQDIYEYCDNIEAIVDLALSLGEQP